MGIYESLSSWFATDVYAEEPAQKDDDQPEEEQSEDSKDEGDAEEGGEDEPEEEEEEEEEEEPEDIKPKIEEECAKTKECEHPVHHYHECVARVTKAQESEDGAKEDCVEEFFHMTHCVAQCAAGKLFKQLV